MNVRRWYGPGVAPLAWAIGMMMLFSPILLSGVRVTFYGLGDVRLVNFMLEHSYRWATSQYLHVDFWSPPVFFPHENVAAYSELLVGAAAPYWLLRAVAVTPVTAYLLWVFFNWTLNYVAAYLLFRRAFGIEALGATLGAFLFSFGSPRSAAIPHQHLAPAFYLLTAFAAIVVVFRDADSSELRRRAWMAAFGAAFVAQAYTAFYPLFFLCLCLLVAAVWALAIGEYRKCVFRVLRRDRWFLGAAGAVTLAAMVPMLTHYLRAAEEIGLRRYPVAFVPRPASWLLMGPRHPWYGWLQVAGGPFADLRGPPHSNGVGLLTTALAIVGLYGAWKRRSVRLLVLVVVTLIVATTVLPGGYSGWRLAYDYLPGAAALRAVARIGMITLLPLSLGIALFFGRLEQRRRWLLLTALGIGVIAEQNHDLQFRRRAPIESYQASLAERLAPGCEAFLAGLRGFHALSLRSR